MNRIFLPLLAALSGCVINGDDYPRPRELESSWLVNRPRLLAVKPEPPEANPGDVVTFTALLADPTGEIESVVWIACPPELSFGAGCALDFEGLDFEDPAALAEAGVIGFEPLFAPVLVLPVDALDYVPEEDAASGVYWMVQLLGLPPGDPDAAPSDGNLDQLDFSSIESGHKRLVVSTSSDPNQNPEIVGVTIDDTVLPAGAVLEVDPFQEYDFGIVLSDDSRQTFTHTLPDGSQEERVEEPFIRWYATSGVVFADTTLDPVLNTTWEAPDSGEEGSLWSVVRDRRGGMTWIEQPFRVR